MVARRFKLHPSITLDRVMKAAERHQFSLDDPGFCLACGAEAMGVEPDACEYECEICGENKVYGAEEILLNIMEII